MVGRVFCVAAIAVAPGRAVARHAAPVALPFVVLWATAPAVARWISQPPRLTELEPFPRRKRRALRLISRRTWRFFEKFVTAEDHWLPPDNFQEDPKPVVAHRTSPTNIGLYLLSTVAARDFGWLGTLDAVERMEATLADDGADGAVPRPFLQLVRHARFASRSTRNMFPPWIAEILPANLIVLGNSCREMVQQVVAIGAAC